MQPSYIPIIATELGIHPNQVEATIRLIDEGATTPFIARYRKELTQSLDEVQIESIRNLHTRYAELVKRKQSILDTIQEQGKLTPDLEQSILTTWDSHVLEDLYLPYKPKRKTKASIAREKGLEPLAHWMINEYASDPLVEAKKYLSKAVPSIDDALQGARDIIADIINEHSGARSMIRQLYDKHAILYARVAKGQESAGDHYKDYFKYEEKLQRCPSHRILAIFRGEEEGFLKLFLEPDEETAIKKLEYLFVKRNNANSDQVRLAIKDAYKRLLSPSMETEFRNLAKIKADEAAIKVFAENLKQLLLAPPLGSKRILAIDPGFRSGCKLTCLDEEGELLYDDVLYPHEPQKQVAQSTLKLQELIRQYKIQAIAIGNGTAGRETETWIRSISLDPDIEIYMVNENGASVYSASEIAREEFPDKELTVRGAISIGRRLADPLAELVKIDAKSIGVGQYQHDVDQTKLKESLDVVVEHCVNLVGVNLNTASKSLLTYVSGINEKTAQNIIEYRSKYGAFESRSQLKKVPRLGDKAFEQAAGFLRIPASKQILDNSAVHPESYSIVEQMARDQNCSIRDLISNEQIRKRIIPEKYVTPAAGLPTIQDILRELAKPGRDPREILQPFSFGDVKKPEDLKAGMILPGIVTNITQFGCFVDIGVKQDGMVHISQLADKFVSDPNTIVKLQQQVTVKVMDVDLARKRISLSMKSV
jgi:uncharacterized protein